MSDEEDYYEDDDMMCWDEGGYDIEVPESLFLFQYLCSNMIQADLLDPIPSPVWNDRDETDEWSDWEYYSDDYYDVDTDLMNAKSAQKRNEESDGRSKKRKLQHNVDDSAKRTKFGSSSWEEKRYSADAEDSNNAEVIRIVRWRKSDKSPVRCVCVDENNLESVSLLKNWREQFSDLSNDCFFSHIRPLRT